MKNKNKQTNPCKCQIKVVTLQAKLGGNNMYTFEPVKFNSEEERLAAKRKMVGMRKEFEARVREIMAKRAEMQAAL